MFFGETQMKQVIGKSTQIITPIVDPIKPKTSSILGIKTPIINDEKTIIKVKLLNFPSGI